MHAHAGLQTKTAPEHLTLATTRRRSTCRPAALALALAAAFASGHAQTLPTGGVAIHGSAAISQPGAQQLVVTTRNGALGHSAIDWQSFSISSGASVRFDQPGAGSLSINRVVTASPSALFGTLSSNGRLVLVNPSGITVGAGAVVDTAGFTASALRMTDADALSGRLRFGSSEASMGGAAGIVVDGRITARDGDVVLIAPSVGVGASALVQAANGSTILAAGQQVEITGRGLEGIHLLVQAREHEARNLGRLQGDAVGIFAGTLRHSGDIQATSAAYEGGRVVLRAAGDAYVEGAGTVRATGRQGGQIDVLGERVALTGAARVDASGDAGGGSIRIGGDFQGRNADIPNADKTYLGPDTLVRADAGALGDGGRVIVWADDLTRAHGTVSARGGAHGGDGGFVEISGKRQLLFDGQVALQSPLGTAGTLLLDPDNIDVSIGGLATIGDVNLFGINIGQSLTVSPATLNAVGGNVMLQATEDINFNDPVNLTTLGASLTAFAGGIITVGAAMTTNQGVITLYANHPGAGGTGPNGSAVYVNAPINSNGANITLRSDGSDVGGNAIFLNANVNAGAGILTLNAPNDRIDQASGSLVASVLSANADYRIDLSQAGNLISSDVGLSTNTGTASGSLVQLHNNAPAFNLNGATAKGNVVILTGGSMTTDGAILSTTGSVSITTNGNLSFADDVTSASTLSLSSNGGLISQSAGSLVAAGLATFNAGSSDVLFGSQTNDFSTVSVTGGQITLVDANALTITARSQPINGNLYLEARTGALTVPAGAIDTGSGQLSLLSGAGAFTTPGALNGSDILLRGISSLTLAHNVSASASMTLLSSGSMTQSPGTVVAASGAMGVTAAGTLTVQGGAGSPTRLESTGNQTISAADILVQGGNGGSSASAAIRMLGAANTQDITASNGITITAGANGGGVGVGNFASIVSNGNQQVAVGNGGLTLQGGGGSGLETGNAARLAHDGGGGTSQTITINGTGSINITAGSSALSGMGEGNGSNASIHSDNGGSQTINFTGGGGGRNITITGGTNGSDAFAEIYAGAGTQTITGANLITLTGGASGGGLSDVIASHGNEAGIIADVNHQVIGANGITLQGGAAGINNFAAMVAGGNQSINVGSGGISLTGGSGGAGEIKNGAFLVKTADVPATAQTITIGGGGSLTLQGGTSSATAVGSDSNLVGLLNSSAAMVRADGSSQLIEFTAAGSSIAMTGGSVGSNNVAFIQALNGSQTIRGDIAAHAPTITLAGGNSGGIVGEGNRTLIAAETGTQLVDATSISITGGAGGVENLAQIRQGGVAAGLGETQTVSIASGNALALQGGGGNTNLARIQAYGLTQTVSLGSGSTLDLTGGTGSQLNFARIEAFNGDQFVTGASAITLTGGSAGGALANGNFADIRQRNAATAQSISGSSLSAIAGSGGIDNTAGLRADGSQTVSLTSGGSNALILGNAASLYDSYISGNNQVITAGTGVQSGSITVRGGATAGRNSGIFNNAGAQTVSTTGTLSLTGGTALGTATCNPATSGACADISNSGTGLQTVTANTILMQGGGGGIANGAGIFVNAGDMLLNVGAGGLHLVGGTGTSDNFATIGGSGANGRTLTINVAGDTTLDSSNGTDGSGALIGLGGTGNLGSVSVDFNGTGNLTLTGSNVSTLAGAGFGASGNQTNAFTLLTIDAANVTLNAGSQRGPGFGHSPASNGPGSITVNASGNIALNSNGSVASGIITTGTVTLTAGGTITEGTASMLSAGQVIASAVGGLNLDSQANLITNLTATNTGSGDITVANNPANLLTVTGMTQFAGGNIIIGADDLDIVGPVSAPGGAVTLRPLTLTRAVHVEPSNSGNVLSLSPSDLSQVTTGVLQLGRADGTGNLNLSAGIANANFNAGTLLLVSGNDVALGAGAAIGAAGAEFNHELELRAANNVQLTGGSVFLADNHSLKAYADNDGSLLGNVSIGAGTYRVGAGAGNTSGMMDIKGAGITVAVSGNGSGLVEVTGSGSQTFTATDSNLQFLNQNAGSGNLLVRTATGTQTLSAATGALNLVAGTGAGTSVSVSATSGSQIVGADALNLSGGSSGTNNTSSLFAGGAAQTITVGASGIQLSGGSGTGADGNNSALVSYSGSGAQAITVNGGGDLIITGGSSALQNVGVGNGSRALIETTATGNQTITLSGGNMTLQGGSVGSRNYAALFADLASQTISGVNMLLLLGGADGGVATEGNRATMQAGVNQNISAASVQLMGGADGTENYARILLFGPGAATQTVSTNALSLQGGNAGGGLGTGNFALIQSAANQNINVAGNLVMNGGSGPLTDNAARIETSTGSSGTQSIMLTGGSLNMTGGSSTATTVGATHGSRAIISSGGTAQVVQLSSGGSINLTGGFAGQRNFANITAQTGSQTISGADAINLTGGSGGGVTGEGNGAYINSEVGNQSVSAGAITLAGGAAGTENLAQIRQGSASAGLAATQTITVTGGGALSLDGGAGISNLARVQAFGTDQNIAMGAGAALDLTGGTGASNNLARIHAVNGNQSVSGNPDITLVGGASGGADLAGNSVDIRATGVAATQTITAGDITIQAGAAGQENYAGIHGMNQSISTLGDLSLTGGGSAPSLDGTSGGGARIGASGSSNPTNLALNVGGNLTLTGGSVAGSAIGSNRVGGQPTNLTITTGGDLTLNPGSVATAGSRIGSPASNMAGGNISIIAGGDFSMSGATSGETRVATLGAIDLQAATVNIGNSIVGGTVLIDGLSGVSINTSSGEAGSITASATSGTGVKLISGTTFSNSSGAGAISVAPGAHWRVYSVDPALDTVGGLVYDFKQYNAVPATAVQGSGNGVLYSIAPTATVVLGGPIDKVYDSTTAATLAPANFSVSGGLAGDTLSVTGGSSGTYDNANAGVGKTVTVNPASVTVTALEGSIPVYGYGVSGGPLVSVMGSITPAPLTVGSADVVKPYDGTTSAAGTPVILAGSLFGSDTLAGGSFAFLDKNVGNNKTVTVGGISVADGNGGNNYSITLVDNLASSITALTAATWTGSVDTSWTNPSNWLGGVVPDLGNVQSVSIPAGAGSVVFDASAGTTSLQTLTSARPISVTGGNLQIGALLQTGSYSQSGGVLSGGGTLNVTDSFSQSGGSIALAGVHINQTSGNLTVGNMSASAMTLAAPTGAINQIGSLVAGTLATHSQNGMTLISSGNQIGSLTAGNTGGGNIQFSNTGPLAIQALVNAGGDIDVINTGAINTVGLVSAPTGHVYITANSPLTVGASGIVAGGDIVLVASNLSSAGDLTLNGPLAAGNLVNLTAGNAMVQNAAVFGANGVTADAGTSMTYGPLAIANNPPVAYSVGGVPVAPPPTVLAVSQQQTGDILVTFVDLFQQAVEEQFGELLEFNPDGSLKRKDLEGVVTEEEVCR